MPKPYRVCVQNMITMITVITQNTCYTESINTGLVYLIGLISMLYGDIYSLAAL